MSRFWHLLFLPQPKNNHKALLIQPGFIGLFIAVYLLNQSIVRSLTMVRPGVLGYSSEITAEKTFNLTNREREKQGLAPFVYNQQLEEAAISKALDMLKKDYWAHSSPQGDSPWVFFQQAGYQYQVAGENLARDFYDTESMLKAWMNSKSHRENILDKRYEEIGIGVVNGTLGGVKTTLVVQHFGKPAMAVAPSKPRVLSAPTKYALNPLLISKVVGGAIFMIIMGVLAIDAAVILKNKQERLSGSATSHLGFLVIIFLLLIFSRPGTILP